MIPYESYDDRHPILVIPTPVIVTQPRVCYTPRTEGDSEGSG